MKYWWVNQTDNWQDEFNSGYLYAGKSSHAYRKSILDVRVGDLVICTHGTGEKRRIYAVGIIVADPSGEIVSRRQTRTLASPKKQKWPFGWEVQINYRELADPVLWPPIRSRIPDNYVAKHFTKKSRGVQGYLFPLPSDTAGVILRAVNEKQPAAAKLQIIEATNAEQFATAFAAEVMVRIGHQKWSEDVKRMWGGRCCATGFNVMRLLRASHIVPWSEDERIRLDRHNGLCFSPSYDAAFDAHLITFQDDGRILLSAGLSAESAGLLGIDPEARIVGLVSAHLKHLERHRAAFKTICLKP